MTISFSAVTTPKAVDCCKQYLTGFKKNSPADYVRIFGNNDGGLKFKPKPSVKTVSASCGRATIFPVIISNGDKKLAEYSLLRDKSGHCCDDWLDVIA